LRKYGEIELKEGFWVINTEPQVSLRFKRIFEGVAKGRRFGTIALAATPQNSRDLLEMFLLRYPMEIDEHDQAEMEELAEKHREQEALVANILADDYEAPEFDLALPPREYQRIAAELAMRTGRLLVADDVGLGKTATSICTLTDPANLPALVVTLTHLPRQWQAEISKFAPKLRTHVVKKGTPYDMTVGKRGKKELFPDVIIMNYHKLRGWSETLAGTVKAVIYDECQELRRSESLKYEAASWISENAELKVGLSATPIYNYGGEIFSVMNALAPGCLGEQYEFRREWCDSDYGDKPRIRDPKAFGSFLRENGLMLRRTRKEVGRELEDLMKIPHAIDADISALDKISDSAAELAKIILSQNETRRGLKMQAAEQLSNVVRQATGVAKAPYVADFVRMLVESGESVVLYGWHREVYGIWKAKLADLNPLFYTGTESAVQKAVAVEQFCKTYPDGEHPNRLLIMSLRSGAGVDGLQHHCRTVVFGELDWSPGVHDQCCGRVHRDGQTDPVAAYFLLSDYGSDPTMSDVLGMKRQQMQGIRDPNAELIARSQQDPGNAKRLAEGFLKQRGIEFSEPEPDLAKVISLFPEMSPDEAPNQT